LAVRREIRMMGHATFGRRDIDIAAVAAGLP
jgi:hypothetical protein